MTLLEDAKRLAEVGSTNAPVYFSFENDVCAYCDQIMECGGDHKSDCPWLSLPQIVKVLEAAERLVQSRWPSSPDGESHPWQGDADVVSSDVFDALVIALKGEVVPASSSS